MIAAFFDAILDDFRRSYILHYVPEGVSRAGWHQLRVEMPAESNSVRTRPGYWGAPERVAAAPSDNVPATTRANTPARFSSRMFIAVRPNGDLHGRQLRGHF